MPFLDLEIQTFLRSPISDITGGNGPEKLSVLTRTSMKGQRDMVDLGCPALRLQVVPPASFFGLNFLIFEALDVGLAGFLGQSLRKDVITAVPGRDVYDFAGITQVLHGFAKNQLHEFVPRYTFSQAPFRGEARRALRSNQVSPSPMNTAPRITKGATKRKPTRKRIPPKREGPPVRARTTAAPLNA